MNEYIIMAHIIMSGPHHCVRMLEGPTGACGRRMVCV